MLLGNSHIEASLGEFLLEIVKPRATAHGSMDGHNFTVQLRLFDQRLCKVLGVGKRRRFGFELLSSLGIKLNDT